MRLGFMLIVAMLTVSAHGATPIKVMTFNIRFDSGANPHDVAETPWQAATGPHRRDMVLKVINDESPDLLALQEALNHQVDDIRAHCPSYDFYSVGRDDGAKKGEHCAIFFRAERFEELDSGTFWLCDSPDDPGGTYPGAACPRIASWVRLRDREQPQGELVLVNTHWDHVSQPAREFCANSIVDHLVDIAPGDRIILVGDLNSNRKSKEVSYLLDNQRLPLIDAYRVVHPVKQPNEATFNGFANRTRGEPIDYVFHTKHFHASSARIVRTLVEHRNPSDHFPVVVELRQLP